MTTMDEPSVSYQSYRKQRSAWTGSLRRFRDWLSLVVLHSCFRFLSLSSAQTLGKGVGRLAYRLLAKDRGIARKNLAIAYPQHPLATREQWVKECFQHYGQFLFEFLLMQGLMETHWQPAQGHASQFHVQNANNPCFGVSVPTV